MTRDGAGARPLRLTNLISPVLFALAGLAGAAHAGVAGDINPVRGGEARPSIALIIDDLGNQQHAGRQAITLPGPVACAFLPDGHFTPQLAQQAHGNRKEVMLHLPMQSVDRDSNERGEMTLDMSQQRFNQALLQKLAAVPHVSGINNHRGSLLTRHPGHMAWLMQGMAGYGDLFFVDSRTTKATVARRLADEYGIPAVDRKVFLDNERDAGAVSMQFRRLLEIARREGTALGIGHPYPETLALLNRELPRLADYNIQLVPVRQLIELENGRKASWQASLSR